MPSALNKTLRIPENLSLSNISTVFDAEASGWARSGIFQGDALDALRSAPSNWFDLIIADPPYNSGRDFGNDSDRQTEADFECWTRSWISAVGRVSAPNASMYICSDWRHGALIESELRRSGWHVINRITWKRDKGRGAKKNWKQNMEDIWFAVRDSNNYRFNLEAVKVVKKVVAPYRENGVPKDWTEAPNGERSRLSHPSNIWTDLVVPFWSMPENTVHPTQKPEKLIERLVLASSSSGDRVLDLFSGSGTTSVVANRLGRQFCGIELNPGFVALGLERLAREMCEK